jgi:hypothetical protein
VLRTRGYGLPTKLVTLWASSVALKRGLLTVMALLEARLSVAEVTRGVMLLAIRHLIQVRPSPSLHRSLFQARDPFESVTVRQEKPGEGESNDLKQS